MVRENNRRRVLELLLAGALLGMEDRAVHVGLLCIVMFFGCLGAYVSIQRRLQNTSDGGDPVIGILLLHEFYLVQVCPLIAGGVFRGRPLPDSRGWLHGRDALSDDER
jgi:hypothetical protein